MPANRSNEPSKSKESPVKLPGDTKKLVEYAAMLLNCTQGEFVERSVAEFLDAHEKELEDLKDTLDQNANKLKADVKAKYA